MACIYGIEQDCGECRMCASVNSKVTSGHNMVRLTIKAPSGLIHLKDNKEATINTAIKKLSDYEDLEAQGKLLKLPCAVGDAVYQHMIIGVDKDKRKPIYKTFEATVFKFSISSFGLCFWTETVDEGKYQNEVPLSAFGKTVFLTKSAAEQALKEMEDIGN